MPHHGNYNDHHKILVTWHFDGKNQSLGGRGDDHVQYLLQYKDICSHNNFSDAPLPLWRLSSHRIAHPPLTLPLTLPLTISLTLPLALPLTLPLILPLTSAHLNSPWLPERSDLVPRGKSSRVRGRSSLPSRKPVLVPGVVRSQLQKEPT